MNRPPASLSPFRAPKSKACPAQARRSWIANHKLQGAFTRTDLLVVLAILAILILLAGLVDFGVPAEAGRKAARATCQNNLKQVGLAFRTWEGDHNDLYPMSWFTNSDGSMDKAYIANPSRYLKAMADNLNNPRVLFCPADTNRSPASDFRNFDNSNLSYFVGLDADEYWPSMPLSGDRNLVTNSVDVPAGFALIRTTDKLSWSSKIHNHAGNLLLSDGSVQQANDQFLQKLFQSTGTNLTRLAIP